MIDLKQCIGLGIAGNFANHLEQAKEGADFLNVKTKDDKAPKGIFPFYTPIQKGFLHTFPIGENLALKNDEEIQVEPEIAIVFEIDYDEEKKVKDLKALKFTVFNDGTIRKSGVSKISFKKNWGGSSKGIGDKFIDIDKFSFSGIMDEYNLVSYLKRDGKMYQYGKDSKLLNYSYFYETLTSWLIEKMNTQKDFSVLENIADILKDNEYPQYALITIGATEYTEFGETHYLQVGDEIFILAYTNGDDKSLKNTDTKILLHQKVL